MTALPSLTPGPLPPRRVMLVKRMRSLSPALAATAAVVLAAIGAAVAWLLAAGALPGGAWGAAAAAAVGAVLATLPLALALAWTMRAAERGRSQALLAGAVDPATGVPSRPAFLALAEREFARSRRYGIGAAMLLVDVDRFRRLVESQEPALADLLLREIAASTQATLRGADALSRFGTAQLAVFLAHADPLGALDVAERIRERIEQLEIVWHDQRMRATVSVGVVMMRPAHLSLQAVIDDAEAALGAARHAGGNCVRSAPVDPRRQRQPGPAGPSVGDKAAGL